MSAKWAHACAITEPLDCTLPDPEAPTFKACASVWSPIGSSLRLPDRLCPHLLGCCLGRAALVPRGSHSRARKEGQYIPAVPAQMVVSATPTTFHPSPMALLFVLSAWVAHSALIAHTGVPLMGQGGPGALLQSKRCTANLAGRAPLQSEQRSRAALARERYTHLRIVH